MVKETKFYEVLGVEPSASEAQLKTAYKKGALKFHPDKNPGNAEAEHKFKELSHAYETLADPQKRQVYDQFGEAGLEQGGGGGAGMSAEDLFSQFFGGGGGGFFGGGGGFGGRQREPQVVKAKTISHVLKVSLEDVYKGKTSKLALQRTVRCGKCNGRGGKEGAVKSCDDCGGKGQQIFMQQTGPFMQQVRGPCRTCRGRGEIIRDKDKCTSCRGDKVEPKPERKVLHVHIDKGVEHGKVVMFPGEGDWLPGADEPGDVAFTIEVQEHKRFQRKKDDLYYNVEIDLLTALAGGVIQIEHLDDRWLNVEIPPGQYISPGTIKVLRRQGMPSYRHHDHGDLFIQFKVTFPKPIEPSDDEASLEKKMMTEEKIKMLEAVLPPRKEGVLAPKDAMVDDFPLDNIETEAEYRRALKVDEDADGDEQMGGERVQCATQ